MHFESEGLRLEAHLALPERVPSGGSPGLVICHGFPTAAIGAERSGQSYHSLADRIAEDKGNVVMVMHYRGCGASEGNFSLRGWLRDVEAAVDALGSRPDVSSVSLMGFGTGAALVICAAANRPEVLSVAAVAPPADFADWSDDPEHLLAHARRVGAIKDESFPQDFAAWAAELSEIRALTAAGEMESRPLLILHGQDDDLVPVFDSRIVADSHGSAELRVVHGAGHLLRYDPRAVAILFGWIDRQRYSPA